MIRWYGATDEPYARDLFALCHPTWPDRPEHWFHAHPTLVLPGRTRLLGMTSFTLSPMPDGIFAYFLDLCVLPRTRGKGYGGLLFDEREKVARSFGAVFLIAVTDPGNAVMASLLASRGFTPKETTDVGEVWTKA